MNYQSDSKKVFISLAHIHMIISMLNIFRPRPLTNYARGIWAERIAVAVLWVKGYRIRERRYKTSVGEIDIIATRGTTVAFIEVKARATVDAARGAILRGSYTRLVRAAQIYMVKNPKFSQYNQRFDLIAVALPASIVHLYNIDLIGA